MNARADILSRLIAAVDTAEPFERDQLLRDLIDDLGAPRPRVQRRPSVCVVCGLDCEWPGLLERHVLAVHREERAA